jgi:cold shock CspA family protein
LAPPPAGLFHSWISDES